MSFVTDALVLKVSDVGESDRVVTLLSSQYGVIRAFANRAKKINSKMNSATQTFCYGEFSIYTGKESYIIESAVSKEVFFGLREDISKLALGQHFCSLAMDLIPEGEPAPDSLRVILNSLAFLVSDKRSQDFLKAVTELKLLSLAGFSPDTVTCGICGRELASQTVFDTTGGRLYCREHGKGDMFITPGVLTAMRHVIYSPTDRIYSFTLSPQDEKIFAKAAESFLLRQTGRSHKALDFYKTVTT